MDELFERIKVLEDENKFLQKEFNDLNDELQEKKMEHIVKEWLPEKEKEESEKKLYEYTQKLNEYKKLIDENFTFPVNQDVNNVTLPATLKNPKFDEKELLNFFKLVNDEKNEFQVKDKKI